MVEFMNLKKCSRCEKEQETSNFWRDQRNYDGLNGTCKTCGKEASKQWRIDNKEKNTLDKKNWYQENKTEILAAMHDEYKNNPEPHKLRQREGRKWDPDKYRNYDLKKKYGITLEDKLRMFKEQGEKCKVCGSTESRAKYPGITGWHVDHDHITDEVRGILCHPCNLTIGQCDESIIRLEKIIEYLKANKLKVAAV
jgi:hypothetical protein